MDQTTFTHLAETYMDMVYRLACHYLRSPQDADDVTQEVFLRLLRTETAFDGEEHARHWLVRVTLNEAKRLCRSPWRQRTAPLEDFHGTAPLPGEEQRALFEAVMALPRKYRVPLYLYYFEGYGTEEIGAILSRPPSTVQTQLARAREKLRQMWKEEEP